MTGLRNANIWLLRPVGDLSMVLKRLLSAQQTSRPVSPEDPPQNNNNKICGHHITLLFLISNDSYEPKVVLQSLWARMHERSMLECVFK